METATQPIKNTNLVAIKDYFKSNGIQEKFKELLGNKAAGFITSVLQVVNSNKYLANCDPASIYGAAAAAAILDLPINNNLGFAYIVPYNEKRTIQVDGKDKDIYVQVAQFQMGYKGFIQLGQRSGLMNRIGACPIYEGQIIEENPLTGYVFDFKKKKSDTIVGYASYFRLNNGFENTWYMSAAEMNKHAKKYSQTFKKNSGRWVEDFDKMARKTVLKLNLSLYAPLSIEMQKAIMFDQARINDPETEDITYVDGTEGEAAELDWNELQTMYDFKKEYLTADEQRDADRILNNKEQASFSKLHNLLKGK